MSLLSLGLATMCRYHSQQPTLRWYSRISIRAHWVEVRSIDLSPRILSESDYNLLSPPEPSFNRSLHPVHSTRSEFAFFQNEVYCLPSRSIIVSSELRTPKSTRSLRSAALGSLKIHFYLAPTAAVRCGEPTFTFMIKMLPELQFFFRNREDILEEIINETYDRLSVVNCNTQPSHVMAPCTDLNFGAIDLSTPRLRGGD